MNRQKIVTDKELAELTPWSRASYQRSRSKGGGPPFIRKNGRIYYDLDEVLAWFTADKFSSTSEYESRSDARLSDNNVNASDRKTV